MCPGCTLLLQRPVHPPTCLSLRGIPESPDCFDLHTALSYPGLNRDPCIPASLEMKPKLLEVPMSSLRGKQGAERVQVLTLTTSPCGIHGRPFLVPRLRVRSVDETWRLPWSVPCCRGQVCTGVQVSSEGQGGQIWERGWHSVFCLPHTLSTHSVTVTHVNYKSSYCKIPWW